jgi:hypothetical protein
VFVGSLVPTRAYHALVRNETHALAVGGVASTARASAFTLTNGGA